jgi:hypothetical protein
MGWDTSSHRDGEARRASCQLARCHRVHSALRAGNWRASWQLALRNRTRSGNGTGSIAGGAEGNFWATTRITRSHTSAGPRRKSEVSESSRGDSGSVRGGFAHARHAWTLGHEPTDGRGRIGPAHNRGVFGRQPPIALSSSPRFVFDLQLGESVERRVPAAASPQTRDPKKNDCRDCREAENFKEGNHADHVWPESWLVFSERYSSIPYQSWQELCRARTAGCQLRRHGSAQEVRRSDTRVIIEPAEKSGRELARWANFLPDFASPGFSANSAIQFTFR